MPTSARSGTLPTIRPGAEADLPELTELYNHYVRHSTATFDIEPFTPQRRRREWFAHYRATGPHRLLVAVDGADVPLG
jgi:phosphinothricin acetyltransferase